jgi:hypothetical protein
LRCSKRELQRQLLVNVSDLRSPLLDNVTEQVLNKIFGLSREDIISVSRGHDWPNANDFAGAFPRKIENHRSGAEWAGALTLGLLILLIREISEVTFAPRAKSDRRGITPTIRDFH